MELGQKSPNQNELMDALWGKLETEMKHRQALEAAVRVLWEIVRTN